MTIANAPEAVWGPPGSITVIRLPTDGRAPRDPIATVLATVGRVDMALCDALHSTTTADGRNITRPYSCVRRGQALDVVVFGDVMTQLLLRGDPNARIVARTTLADIAGPGDQGEALYLAFDTPTRFKVANRDHLLPDPGHVFSSMRTRWDEQGWPPLPEVRFDTIAAEAIILGVASLPRNDGIAQRGFVGLVKYDLAAKDVHDRAVIWGLARYAQYSAIGRGTRYGFGRVRISQRGESWRYGALTSAWEVR